ncbi:MAG: hypothetical protein ACJZ8O_05570 [Pirellulaceae bacterium]
MRFQPANSKSIPLWTLCILIIQTVTVSAQDRDYVEFGRKALEQQGKLPWYDQKGDQFKSVPLGPIDDKSLIDSDLPFDDEFLNEDLNFDRLEEYLQDPESRRQFEQDMRDFAKRFEDFDPDDLPFDEKWLDENFDIRDFERAMNDPATREAFERQMQRLHEWSQEQGSGNDESPFDQELTQSNVDFEKLERYLDDPATREQAKRQIERMGEYAERIGEQFDEDTLRRLANDPRTQRAIRDMLKRLAERQRDRQSRDGFFNDDRAGNPSNWDPGKFDNSDRDAPDFEPPDFSGFSFGISGAFMQVLVYIIVGLVVIAVVIAIVYAIINREKQPKKAKAVSADDASDLDERAEELPFQLDLAPATLLDRIRQCYANGEFNQAIVYLFSYQLLELDKRHCIKLTRGKTNHQYLRELVKLPSLKKLLSSTVYCFEDVFFGNQDISKTEFDECWLLIDEFHRSLPGGVQA